VIRQAKKAVSEKSGRWSWPPSAVPAASPVVHAIAAGRKAAEAIDRFLLQKK